MRFVKEAFESNYIAPLGPQVDAFEKEFAEYIGIKHCLALSSGTAAMHLQPVFNPQITQISTDYKGGKRSPCRVVGGEVAEDLFERGLCLPSGTAMTGSNQNRVIDVILACHKP